MCLCVSVSAENVEKSLRQMERQLLQLERDLETFSSPDDQSDMFFVKMAISFFTCSRFTAEFVCCNESSGVKSKCGNQIASIHHGGAKETTKGEEPSGLAFVKVHTVHT